MGPGVGQLLVWAISLAAVAYVSHRITLSATAAELEKERAKRDADRKGRIAAEKALRQAQNAVKDESGGKEAQSIPSLVVGWVESVFKKKLGTPRQPGIVKEARGRIRMVKSVALSPPSLDGLQEYSHAWVIFYFHENTNLSEHCNVKAKVKPPRLNGKKVGIYATRTPHRPNAIGLSVVEITGIEGDYILIANHDLVHGTPVLDIKPYIGTYDALVGDALRQPRWILDAPRKPLDKVHITEEAMQRLTRFSSRLQFYRSADEFASFLRQALAHDIRSTFRSTSDEVFEICLDKLWVYFRVLDGAAVIHDFAPA
eukprot:Clim_evm114s157 gene=Clim_evmTU114s157